MGKVLFDKLQCIRCHIVGAQGVTPGEAAAFAPNLELVRSRLRPDWLVQWLKDPNAIMPGTRMPTYPWGETLRSLDPSIDPDPNKQILAVRNYLLHFSANASTVTATRPASTLSRQASP
jgi:mono/diheme cytochrome c family protein